MADYGITKKGVNIKRLDVILDEMHSDLSERWGVNTKQNPESFLNHFLTNVADKIAELWEFGEDVYFSQYPATAEGISLDNAAQYGGSIRNEPAKSYYPIHCTGIDGTILETGTIISSTTNPTTQLSLVGNELITRARCNKAVIRCASVSTAVAYTVSLNGVVYAYTPSEATQDNILQGIKNAITDIDYTVAYDNQDKLLTIEYTADVSANITLILSNNLTTENVTTIITFGTIETGDILLPLGVITNIVKANAGLLSVENKCTYVAGRDEEDDVEFRQSYVDKIFNRSSYMLESIRSAILQNVQGVKSVAPYENYTNTTDSMGRPPHSVEIVVDGGNATEIAEQILKCKAGGISTYGDVEVNVKGAYDEDIKVRFNRPTKVYVWFKITVTQNPQEEMPSNYDELISEVVLDKVSSMSAGEDIIPQKFISELYKACSGMAYVDIKLFSTTDQSESPTEYEDDVVTVTAREIAYTTESMIEVGLHGD